MALQTPPALVRTVVALVVTAALAGCGGGTTGGRSVAPETRAATSPGPAATAQTAPRTPATATSPAAPPAAPRTATAEPARTHASAPDGRAPDARPTTSGDSPASSAAQPTPALGAAAPPPEQAPDPEPAGKPIDEHAELALTERVSPAHYFQAGTVTGTFEGTMALEARITSKGVIVDFTATVEDGTIVGRGVAVAVLDSSTWPGLRGTAAILGGTGRYAGMRGRALKVTGRARPDGSRARVRLAGTVSYE